MKSGSEFGKKLQTFVNAGQLVPDDLTTEIVVKRLGQGDCRKGYLLDGFPRTVAQAESLDRELGKSGAKIDAVVCLELDGETITKRMGGRRVCPSCGASFHVATLKPKVKGVCDRCGAALVQRDDDKPETVKQRLAVYAKSTAPLIEYYTARGVLKGVDAEGTPAEVRSRVFAVLGVG
jgi:adenylate kinase